MQIIYNSKSDILYIRLDDTQQDLINQRVSEDVVLDLGNEDKIVGIEILDASAHLNLKNILPIEYQLAAGIHA
jgi:uncharacterized protein YuzE